MTMSKKSPSVGGCLNDPRRLSIYLILFFITSRRISLMSDTSSRYVLNSSFFKGLMFSAFMFYSYFPYSPIIFFAVSVIIFMTLNLCWDMRFGDIFISLEISLTGFSFR